MAISKYRVLLIATNHLRSKRKMELLEKITYVLLAAVLSGFIIYLFYFVKKGIIEFNEQWLNVNKESE